MKIVGVTACMTGVAHTYMAKEALEKEARKRGHEVKVETQGSMGIESDLSQSEIDEADVAVLAIAIEIEEADRFDEKKSQGKLITIDPSILIKDPAKIVDRIEQL
jgi:PTS system fructose-specific IIB component